MEEPVVMIGWMNTCLREFCRRGGPGGVGVESADCKEMGLSAWQVDWIRPRGDREPYEQHEQGSRHRQSLAVCLFDCKWSRWGKSLGICFEYNDMEHPRSPQALVLPQGAGMYSLVSEERPPIRSIEGCKRPMCLSRWRIP